MKNLTDSLTLANGQRYTGVPLDAMEDPARYLAETAYAPPAAAMWPDDEQAVTEAAIAAAIFHKEK